MLKSASQTIYQIQWSLAWKLCLKEYLLLTCQILGLLVNTLATDEKYLALNREKLTVLVQMELFEKQTTFSLFFAALLKFILNFEYFEENDVPHSFCISEITDSENVVRKMSKKSCFRRPFDKEYGKRAQTLLKSES